VSLRDDLLRACAQGDQLALRRAGWVPVWEALKTWWPKAFASTDMRPYVALLADEPPDRIVIALEAWIKTSRGQFRPSPAEVMHALHGDDETTGDGPSVDLGRCRNPFLSDRAIAAVADALKAGEQPCRCEGFQSSRFHYDGPRKGRPTLACSGAAPATGSNGDSFTTAEDAGLIGEAA
jgi:hypothetical protein